MKLLRKIAVMAAISLVAALNTTADEKPAQAAAAPQRWLGDIAMGPMNIRFLASFTIGENGSAGDATITIPIQGVADAKIDEVTVNDTEIRFIFKPAGAPFGAEFAAKRTDPDHAEGEIKQPGAVMPFTMRRLADGETPDFGLDRPQTPKPPFPYRSEDVTYPNEKDRVTIGATLTLPEGDGPFPAVVLITGSGPQDRDETILGHKPFAVIADRLTRNGIAVLRADDRGVAKSTGDRSVATAENFARDAEAGIAFLRKDKRIDPKRIGLLGHSEGGMVAPMIAADSDDVAFIVLMAGSELPGKEILAGQLAAVLQASGVSADSIDKQVAVQQKFLTLVEQRADEEAIRPAIRELIALQGGQNPEDIPLDHPAIAGQLAAFNNDWCRFFLAHDPRDDLRRVHCPVLALNGTLDLQVLPKDNLGAVRTALADAGNKDVTIVELPGLNHLFQEAPNGLPAMYGQIPQTISPKALDVMTDWIVKKTTPGDVN